jgi:hypothetical protein
MHFASELDVCPHLRCTAAVRRKIMTLTTELDEMAGNDRPLFEVVHPLDDEPEEKIDVEHLPPMRMTRTVRVCLFALRGYLFLIFLMFGLLAFRILQLAGMIHG